MDRDCRLGSSLDIEGWDGARYQLGKCVQHYVQDGKRQRRLDMVEDPNGPLCEYEVILQR